MASPERSSGTASSDVSAELPPKVAEIDFQLDVPRHPDRPRDLAPRLDLDGVPLTIADGECIRLEAGRLALRQGRRGIKPATQEHNGTTWFDHESALPSPAEGFTTSRLLERARIGYPSTRCECAAIPSACGQKLEQFASRQGRAARWIKIAVNRGE